MHWPDVPMYNAGDLVLAFIAGVLSPLGSACVFPLYPAYLAYLTGKGSGQAVPGRGLSIVTAIVGGIIISMLSAGLVYTFLFRFALSSLTGWLTPLLYTVLLVTSIFLITGADLPIPNIGRNPLLSMNPLFTAFFFGFFFGLLALPCNPGPLILLFAVSSSVTAVIEILPLFFLFGIGIAFPLVLVSFISTAHPDIVGGFLSRHKRNLQILSGTVLLAFSVWYLVTLFTGGNLPFITL